MVSTDGPFRKCSLLSRGAALPGKPLAFLGVARDQWPSMENVWEGNRNNGAEKWGEGTDLE